MKSSNALATIMAVAAITMSVPQQQAQSPWPAPPVRPKRGHRKPHVQRMVGGSNVEIAAWNAAVELKRADKRGGKK